MCRTYYIFVTLLFATIFFNSCQSEVNEIQVTEQPKLKYENLKVSQFAELDYSSKRLAYKSLNSQEKYNFWLNHLNGFLEIKEFSSAQKRLIKEAINHLSEPIYRDNNSRIVFKEFIDGNWSKEVLNQFSKQQIQEIFMLITPEKITKYTNTAKTADCNCNVSSLFIEDCPRNSSCYYVPNNCSLPKCEEGECFSCGMMWLDICNASCI